ncbi:MAG TPA: polysaccharide biosynthesis tyrosine autokinase [Kribbella sp.]
MDLHDYFRVLRKRWRILGGVAILSLGAAVLATLAASPVYEARAQLFVSTAGSEDATSLLQGSSFTQQRVKSYADIVTSPQVLEPVIKSLGLETTAVELANRIVANVPLDTVLINVTVRDGSPERLAAIASAVASTFSKTVVQLDRPSSRGPAAVKVSVVRIPVVPSAPVLPNPLRNTALGLVLGLVAGFGLALVRDRLDKGVKGERDIQAVTDVPVIGGIGFDSDAPGRPLIVHVDPHSPRAEAFRQVRTNLQFIDVANHPRSIVLTSAMPGEGKSSVAANLAITLAAAGSRTVLVEGDLRHPRLAEYMGLEGAAGLTTVLIGHAQLHDVLQPWGDQRGLDVLTCGPIPPNPSELLASAAMVDLLRELEAHYDHVIIDSPPLLPVTDAAVLSRRTGGAVMVVGVNRVNRDQLGKALEVLQTVGASVLGVVANLLPAKGPDAYMYTHYRYEDGGKREAPAEHDQPNEHVTA